MIKSIKSLCGAVGGSILLAALPLSPASAASETPIEITLEDGTRVVNTTSLARDVIGYGGPTPIKLYLSEGVISRVEVIEPNEESSSFLDEITRSGFYDRWRGLTPAQAAKLEIDGVSGATYSSPAIIENIRRAAQYLADREQQK